MIPPRDLRKISRGRLKDAEVLAKHKRYDGAIYLCGYSIEIALKARICKTLKWAGFPETRSEFNNLKSFKTHNLDVLLNLSGVENKIKTLYMPDWSIIALWDPSVRYKPIGSTNKSDAQDMINSSKIILKQLK